MGIYYVGIAIPIANVGLVGICCKFVGLECAMGIYVCISITISDFY